MAKGSAIPGWAIGAAIVVLVLLVGFIAWRSFGSASGEGARPPDRDVKAGTYDFRAEVAKGNVGRRHR